MVLYSEVRSSPSSSSYLILDIQRDMPGIANYVVMSSEFCFMKESGSCELGLEVYVFVLVCLYVCVLVYLHACGGVYMHSVHMCVYQ